MVQADQERRSRGPVAIEELPQRQEAARAHEVPQLHGERQEGGQECESQAGAEQDDGAAAADQRAGPFKWPSNQARTRR